MYSVLKDKKLFTLIILFFVSFLFLFLSFYSNFFGTVSQKWFIEQQITSDGLVFSKIVKARKNGIYENNGMLLLLHKEGISEYKSSIDVRIDGLYGYLDDRNEFFVTYYSQVGGQGILFSLLNSLSFIKNAKEPKKIRYFYAFNSALLAIVLSILIALFYLEFNLVTAMIVLLSCIISQWLIVLGKSVYWVTWSMYLPMIAIFYLLFYEQKRDKKIKECIFFFVACLFMLFRSSAGYEYVSTIMISATIPIIFYAIKNSWNFFFFIKRFSIISFGLISGFLLTNIIHILQISLNKNISYFQAIKERILHAGTRMTFANEEFFPNGSNWQKGVTSSYSEILSKYWNGAAFDINQLFYLFNKTKIDPISFGDLILFFSFFSILSLILIKYSQSLQKNKNIIFALNISTWIAFLAPISWFVLAKIHSYAHLHINFLLWHLPFTLFGFALVGFVSSTIIQEICIKDRKLKKWVYLFFFLVFSIYFAFAMKQNHRFYKELNRIKNETIFKTKLNNQFDFYLLKTNEIAYFHPKCSKINSYRRFFLHIYPKNNLNENTNQNFSNLDFYWNDSFLKASWIAFNQGCLVTKKLPINSNEVEKINTGQYSLAGPRIWQILFSIK